MRRLLLRLLLWQADLWGEVLEVANVVGFQVIGFQVGLHFGGGFGRVLGIPSHEYSAVLEALFEEAGKGKDVAHLCDLWV